MQFRENPTKTLKTRRFFIKNVYIKNIYGVLELPKNPRNPL